ncbi:MAG: choice-of-anchor B family protein [Bacteroidetes bacterium]|nr:choice-of-anchor B family protein [Bacteroidota bacterium]
MYLILLVSSILSLGTSHRSEPTSIVRDGYGTSIIMVGSDILVSEVTGFSTPGMIHVLRENDRGSWVVAQSITSKDAQVGDRFGTQMAYSDGHLVVSSPGALGGLGAVYVFSKNVDGLWEQSGRITPNNGINDGFGASIAISGDLVAIGVPEANAKAGQVLLFSASLDWGLVTSLSGPTESGAEFGRSLAAGGGLLAVGSPGYASSKGRVDFFSLGSGHGSVGSIDADAGEEEQRLGGSIFLFDGKLYAANPRAKRGLGMVSVYENARGSWTKKSDLTMPSEATGTGFFGASVTHTGNEIWVSAPLADSFSGAVYRFDNRSYKLLSVISNSIKGGRTQFGNSVSVAGGVAAVGMPGNDYGLGSAVIYKLGDNGNWNEVATYNRPVPDLPAVSGGEVECEDGKASGYACQNVDLVSFIPLRDLHMNRGVRLNDVWGWTDEETGREYGIIGHMEAAVFVDVTNVNQPVVLGELPRTPGSPGSTWRDMKVFKDHAFIVADGAGQHGMQIFDLHRLRNWSGKFEIYAPDVLYTNIASAHNIVINEATGFAYTVGNSSGGETCGGALHMIDINDPIHPVFKGCFNDPKTGGQGSGATHDAQCVTYSGPDADHVGKEICVGANGTAISVADVSDKQNPIAISQGTYPNSAYVHQGWFTEDHRYFYQNDEGDETGGLTDRTRTMIWDLTDLDEPEMIAEYFGDSNSTDHNLYVKGDFMYQTNNASGFRVIDIRNRSNPVEVGFFDTTPDGKNEAGFDGTWSSYPYFKSGAILVTSRREGLFIVRKKELDL